MVSLSPQTGSKETCQIKQKDVCELRQFVCEGKVSQTLRSLTF